MHSRLAAPGDVPESLRPRIPANVRLSAHQVATYRALTERDADVVLNVALTGDGKSLAGQLPALVDGRALLAMYPTNELVHDQIRQVKHSLSQWSHHELSVDTLDAHALDDMVDETGLLRRDALLSKFRNHELVLTNPDIFHYIMQQYYIRSGKGGDAPDRVIGPMLDLFDQFTFDEFHVFGTPETVALTNALIFIDEVTGRVRRKRFLFQSATPDDRFLESLGRAGLASTCVEGEYTHGPANPPAEGWRRILHEAELHFSPLRAEEWVEANLDSTLVPFFLEHAPAAKGAIVVNSVASAHRLVERLRPILEKHDLTVASNTGFDARERRRASYDADLLVGTSTVDVGVDFQINLLVFESRDAGSFLQRLGRLGRHGKFERDGKSHQFEAFEAHALVPRWVHERLFQAENGSSAPLSEGAEIDRERLAAIVGEAFPQPTTFERYARMWGGLQAAAVVGGLYHPAIKLQYADTRDRLARRYGGSLKLSISRELGRLKELRDSHRPIFEEVRSFRGGGDLPAGVIDMRETGAARLKVYSLLPLLANFNVEVQEQEAFFEEVDREGGQRAPFRRAEPVAYLRAWGVRPERNEVGVTLARDLDGWDASEFGVAQVLTGVEVHALDVPGLNRVNRGLRRQHLVALLCLRPPAELARRLQLPPLFPLHPFQSRDGRGGSIAFGRQALLLDTALYGRSDIPCGGEERPFIV